MQGSNAQLPRSRSAHMHRCDEKHHRQPRVRVARAASGRGSWNAKVPEWGERMMLSDNVKGGG